VEKRIQSAVNKHHFTWPITQIALKSMSRMARFSSKTLRLTKLHWVTGKWIVKLHQHRLSLKIRTVLVLFHTVIPHSHPLFCIQSFSLQLSKYFSETVNNPFFLKVLHNFKIYAAFIPADPQTWIYLSWFAGIHTQEHESMCYSWSPEKWISSLGHCFISVFVLWQEHITLLSYRRLQSGH